MFPVACFDLGKFRKHNSGDLEDLRAVASRPGDLSELDPSTACSGRWSRPLGSSHPDVEYPCLQKLLIIIDTSCAYRRLNIDTKARRTAQRHQTTVYLDL